MVWKFVGLGSFDSVKVSSRFTTGSCLIFSASGGQRGSSVRDFCGHKLHDIVPFLQIRNFCRHMNIDRIYITVGNVDHYYFPPLKCQLEVAGLNKFLAVTNPVDDR